MISSDFTLTTISSCRRDSAGRHPHSPASRHLPALPSRVQCVATCRHAAGLAFRPRSGLALIVTLTQAIGFERLAQLLDEVFGIRISEGAIANLIARAQAADRQRGDDRGGSSRQPGGGLGRDLGPGRGPPNWWQWVLLSSTAVYHLIDKHSAGAAVLDDFLGEAKPEVWVADRYAAQAGHAPTNAVPRPSAARFTNTQSSAMAACFAPGFHKLLQRAVGIGQRRADLKDSTLARYRADLDRRLDRLLAATPTTEAGRLRPRHPQMPRRSLPFRHPSRCPHQQRLRTDATAAQRHLPQSNRRLSLQVGCPDLRRRRLGNRHRQAARQFSSPGAIRRQFERAKLSQSAGAGATSKRRLSPVATPPPIIGYRV